MTDPNSPVKGWRSLDWDSTETRPVESVAPSQKPAPSPNIVNGEPKFSRTPRQHIPYPQEELVIQPPPAAANPPSTSPISIILPIFGSLIGIVISVIASTSMRTGAVPIFAFVSLPMMLFSIGGGLYNHFNQKKKYETAIQARETNYRAYLVAQQNTISQWVNEQQRANVTPNPDPPSCVRLAEERGLRLWEREPHDDDFLYLRLGIGNLKPTFQIKVPEVPPGTIQPDPLLAEAASIKSQFRVIPNTAVQLPLKEAGSAGIIGQKKQLLEIARTLLIQLCTHHSPDEVKIVLVIPEKEKEWNWARWLPHIWNSEKSVRYFLATDESKHIVLFTLEEMINQRLFQSVQQNNSGLVKDVSLPKYLFIFADQKIWTGNDKDTFSPLLDTLLTRGKELGVYSVFLTERHDCVPKDCKATVDLTDSSGSGTLTISATGESTRFQPDTIDLTTADRFARSLAAIQLETLSGGERIPTQASIADLFDLVDVNKISIDTLWDNSRPAASLGVPFGLRGGGKKAKIDLQDASVGGFGSHALVGGTTGTGKTQFLQTLILLLAAHFKPTDLQFVLIDYKGGNLMLGLEDLPHIVSSLTNIENQGNQTDLIQRLFDSFNVEISRRAKLLQQRKAANINEYIRNFSSYGPEAEALPHLFIIIDEFAELILKNPNSDLMKRLISLGQIGRYAGVHLILATQNPGTIIHEDLRNVLNTRICLRMGSREASSQILRRSDAFDNITKDQVGRAYIQVGNNDIFESLQVAWGGAPNVTSGKTVVYHTVKTVDLDGSRTLITTQADPSLVEMQMAVLARKVVETARQRGYQRQPGIWLPLLPIAVERSTICGNLAEFDGNEWPDANLLSPVVGLFDDPQNKKQGPLAPDFSANPHLLIFGSPGTGKTTLLHTLLVSLVHQHSPIDLNAYIIDFGGRNFTWFETLPHVGAVVQTGENERVRRLLSYIEHEFEQRRELFEVERVKSITEYRAHSKNALPDIFLFLDNYAGFHDTFVKNQMNTPEFDALIQIAAEGGSLGIHLVMTSSMVTGFPVKVSDRIPMVVSFELNNPLDYSLALGKLEGVQPTKGIHGRGLIKLPIAGQKPRILDFQAAFPAQGDSEFDRNQELKRMVEQMSMAWKDRPGAYTIPPLQKIVQLAEIIPDLPYPNLSNRASDRVTIGKRLASPDLAPFTVALNEGPHFWIAGPGYSGKSSLLQTWLIALADQMPAHQLRFFAIDLPDAGLSRLSDLPHCLGVISDKDTLKNCSIQTMIEKGLADVDQKEEISLIIAIDDFGMFNRNVDANNRAFLAEVGERKRLSIEGLGRIHVHLLVTGAPGDFASSSLNPLVEPIKRGRTGFLVGTNDNNAVYANFGYKLSPADVGRHTMTGHGFYFLRGQSQPVQFAIGRQDDRDWQDWVQRIHLKTELASATQKKPSRAKKGELRSSIDPDKDRTASRGK